MNERIEQLKKQAGAEDFYGGTDCMDVDKFAELIVRECAAMTRNLSPHGELAEKAVKEHFGVK
jgi:hypothetical protein